MKLKLKYKLEYENHKTVRIKKSEHRNVLIVI